MNDYWVGGVKGFDELCMQIAVNHKLFKTFKTNSQFVRVIGNDIRGEKVANEIYNYLKDNAPQLLTDTMLDRFCENDELGEPPLHKFGKREISSGTLIFMLHLHRIISAFGKYIHNIVEIGSGYGGQALILKKYFEESHFYKCVDTEGVLHLCETYLGNWDYDIDFVDANDNIPKSHHELVISNYCLNEMNEEGIDFYMDRIVGLADKAYLAVGNFSMDIPRNKYLIDSLRKHFQYVEIHPEYPKITTHNNYYILASR